MRKGMSPGVLIAMMFAVVAVLIGIVIASATRGRSPTPTPPPAVALQSTAAPLAAPTVALTSLNKSAGATYSFIDAVNTTSLLTKPPPPMPIKVASGEPTTLSGWAVDTAAGGAAGGVIVAVDETTTFPAIYGNDRPDIAAALKSPTYQKSGFYAMLPANTLAPGRHTITIKIITADRTSYYAPSPGIEIEVV